MSLNNGRISLLSLPGILNRAKDHQERGEWDAAEALCLQVLGNYPNHPEGLRRLAVIQRHRIPALPESERGPKALELKGMLARQNRFAPGPLSPKGGRLRILAITVAPDWWNIARLPSRLAAAGFDVAAFCPERSWLAYTEFVCERYFIRSEDLAGELADAITAWNPHLIIPGDEFAAHLLRSLDCPQFPESIRQLTRRSCGNPRFHGVVTDKVRTLEEAARLGIAHPPQAPAEDFEIFSQRHGYPLLLKLSVGMAGLTVRVCANPQDAATALAELRSLGVPAYVSQPSLVVQKHICGHPVSIAFVALDGEILDSFTYGAVEVFKDCGPSSVIRRQDHPEIEQTARRLVAHFGFSGFGGFDFLAEAASGTAHLLEMNPRLTVAGDLGALFGHDLARALHAALTGDTSAPPAAGIIHDAIALFPNEWRRDGNSPHLKRLFMDVPWDDPGLLRRVLSSTRP